MATDVQQPGMGAARKDCDPFASHVSGHKSLVLDEGIGLPLPIVRTLEVILQATLEAPAGDLATEIEQPAQDLLRLGGCHYARALFFKYSARRHILQRKDLAAWQPHGPLDERPGMHVERDNSSTVRCANQLYGL
jgi:hypothetical protein